MNLRLKNLRSEITSEKLDGLITFDPSNIYYLTDTRAENSFVLITKDRMMLVVNELVYPSVIKTANCRVQVFSNSFFQSYKKKKIGLEDSISLGQLNKLKINKGISFRNCSGLIERLRSVKDRSEISKIKLSCKLALKAVGYAAKELKAGKSEKELAEKVRRFFYKNGAENTAFDTIIASGKNSADPHSKPTSRRMSGKDMVVVDLGCVCNGYSSDLTRTLILGKITKYKKRIFEIVKEAQQKAIESVRSGVSAKEVDSAARNFIEKKGFGRYFIHSTGHGVGIDIHEEPHISAKSNAILKEGMVITVEPGIYFPNKFGVRIEDTVLVTKNGCEVLTKW